MSWKLELVKQSIFGLVPFVSRARATKRRLVPCSASIRPYTLEHGFRQLGMLERAGIPIQGRTILELGAGWQPVIPLLFHFAGSGRIYLVDRERLIDRDLLQRTLWNFGAQADEIASRLNVDPEFVRAKCCLPENMSTRALLACFDMEYVAPLDIAASQWPGPPVDLVLSREVLAHLRPKAITRLFRECNRILTADGAMCHIIDNSDHWEHFDESISSVNFLKYEDLLWRLAGLNPRRYLNRMRHFEYLEQLQKLGYTLLLDESQPHEECVEALSGMRVCSRYRDVSPEELAILTSYIVVAKRPTAAAQQTPPVDASASIEHKAA